MVTGRPRVPLRLADFLMVGTALGDAAIAGPEFGVQYYLVGFGLSLAVSSGTISVVSRLQGAGDTRWPPYATVLGSFLVRLPVAAPALPAGFAVTLPVGGGAGLPAVYAAIVADFYTKAAVNTGRWRAVARAAGV